MCRVLRMNLILWVWLQAINSAHQACGKLGSTRLSFIFGIIQYYCPGIYLVNAAAKAPMLQLL
jgi:hypothetical protein